MRNNRRGYIEDRLKERHVVDGFTNCWNWLGIKSPEGYGKIGGRFKNPEIKYIPGKQYLAHRAAWMARFGNIPEVEGSDFRGTVIRHKCDNPSCINPDHLVIGTQYDNISDMDGRKRRTLDRVKGSKHGNSVFTDDQVAEIIGSGKTNGELAQLYGVSKHAIKRLRCGKTKYVSEEIRNDLVKAAKERKGLSRPGVSNPTAKLTREQVLYIRGSKLTTYQLADELGVSQPTIANAKRGATYREI